MAASGENVAKLLNLTVPSRKPLVRYKSFRYQAESWSKARRIVAKVEHHQGELFPRVGFIVTSMSLPSRSVVRFYNKCGTAEQWIKEGKQATHWTRLSCHRFRANEVRLQLSVLAYNLGNLWRRLGLPNRIKSWSLTSLQHRLMKTGGRLVKHARYYWLLLAEGHLNRRLFGDMLHRIWGCHCQAGSVDRARINSFRLQKVSQGAVSAGAPFSPLNQRLWADGRALAPTGEGHVQGSARKDVVFGAARVDTFTVPWPKWKSWTSCMSNLGA